MRTSLLVSFFAIGLAGCSGSAVDDQGMDDVAEGELLPIGPCQAAVNDLSGGPAGAKPVTKNDDPIAKFGVCAKTWKKTVALLSGTGKIDKTTKKRIDGDGEPGCAPGTGYQAAVVGETSEVLGVDDGYRLVMNRACGDRAANKLWFSPVGTGFGFGPDTPTEAQRTCGVEKDAKGKVKKDASGKDIPHVCALGSKCTNASKATCTHVNPITDDVEVIAFDETKKVFNYYSLTGGQWNYHGDSNDLLKGPQGRLRGCANCHTGGGLIMKERRIPWMNWTNFQLTNPHGTEIVADVSDQLGLKDQMSEFTGSTMEDVFIDDSFQSLWNPTRLKTALANLSEGDAAATRALLEPIFCTTEYNLFSSSTQDQGAVSSIPGTFLLDSAIGFGDLSIDSAAYKAAIGEKGSRQAVAGAPGKAETAFSFSYAERSGADMDYATKLANAGGDAGTVLVRAALLTDFTRPVYSGNFMRGTKPGRMQRMAPGRCDLLELAKGVKADPAHPELVMKAIRDMFLDALSTVGTDGKRVLRAGLLPVHKQFLDNLQRTSTDLGAAPEVQKFLAACRKRVTDDAAAAVSDPSRPTMVQDLVKLVSVNREISRDRSVSEIDALFPMDELAVDRDVRLDPVDCTLK